MLSLGRVTGHAIASAQSWCLLKRVENTSKRRCSYARHSLCCGPRRSEATCTEKLSDRWVNKCRAPDAASVGPASVPVLASPGWGGSSPSCRHVSAASAVFSNSAPSTHPAIPLSIWTHHTGLTHLPLRPSRRPAPTLATYSAASLNSGSLRRSHFVVKKTPRAFQSQRAVAS